MMATPAKQVFVFLSFLFVLALPSGAATVIQGGNVIDQTWNGVGTPYIIMGDVNVPIGAFLRIEEGTEVRFAPSDATGAGRDPSHVELTINGTLDVFGTANAPIKFQGQTANPGSWFGIVVRSVNNTLAHAVIQHAANGIFCEGQMTASNVRMFANQTAINASAGGDISLEYGVIHGNVVQGLQINPSVVGASQVSFENCTIHGNGTYGVYVGGASGSVVILDTIITGHGYGVYRAPSATASASVTYSDLWGNGTNLFNVGAGSHVISVDPLYIEAKGADNIPGNVDDDFRLQPNSPCQFVSQDGDDLGAYEITYHLRMLPLRFVGADARIPILGVPGRFHQLQYTEDLTNWFALGSVRASGASLEFTDPEVKPLPRRFYRIRLTD